MNNHMKRLEGKVAIITGANAGIGKATAALFAREGANLVLAARRLDKLKEVEEYAASLGVKAISVSTDVSVAADCRRLVDTCVETFGRVDILVNNAGIDDKNMSITNCDEELWNKVIAVDQTSVYYMMREALRYMAPAGSGSIVNISSIGATRSNAGVSYTAAKMAVIGMTKNVAIQFAGKGIRVNAVCPGPTQTDIFDPANLATFDNEFCHLCGKHFDGSLPRTQRRVQGHQRRDPGGGLRRHHLIPSFSSHKRPRRQTKIVCRRGLLW